MKYLFSKSILLILLICFCSECLLLFYQVNKGISKRRQYELWSEQMEQMASLPELIPRLMAENIVLSQKLSDQSHSEQEEAFIQWLERECRHHKLKLLHFPSDNREQNVVQEQTFKIGGSFTNMLRLIWYMEQKQKIAVVQSIRLQREKARVKGNSFNMLSAQLTTRSQ